MTCPICNTSLQNNRKGAIYCSRKCKDKAKHIRQYNLKSEEILAKNRQYYSLNKESILTTRKEYYQQNKSKFAQTCAKRYAAKTKATPTWLDEFDLFVIEEFYDLAQRRGMQVDHIIPIRGVNVCGLHVPKNLQLLSKEANLAKGNRYECS